MLLSDGVYGDLCILSYSKKQCPSRSLSSLLCSIIRVRICLEVGFFVAPLLLIVVLDCHLLGAMGHAVLMFHYIPMFGQLDCWRFLEM